MAANVMEIYGSKVFNEHVMKERLPSATYKSLKDTLHKGAPLDIEVANVVASVMKRWAMEQGATHFTHWFQPLTGATSEKHDSFVSPVGDGTAIMEFSGKELVRGEPDASSFPSGGLRATCEARGYTAWDPTSYAFVKDDVLCIPTAFASYTGEALDKKTPLLRSMKALSDQARRILKLFGKNVDYVSTTVGPEQEYFLIRKEDYETRQDLILTGRTLFGAPAAKGQELEEHYFGTIRPRVSAFMKELDDVLWELGIPAKTKHNEVAPCQHELAPIFDTTNVAIDHNLLTMEMMQKLAPKYGLVCLLHEKPFEGVNGSGKHNNWSMSTSKENLLDPGDTPMENLQFLVFLAAVIKAVDEYADLLRTSVATPGNDHRLGANEAPPAIISIFMGEELEAVIDAIASDSPYAGPVKVKMDLGVDVLPKFSKDTTDRNRTSPFAFTGNKFEFRMPGSHENLSDANTILNTAVAKELKGYADELEASDDFPDSVIALVKRTIRDHRRVIFNGDGYSHEWELEAERRGLPNKKYTPAALPALIDPKNIALMEEFGVMTRVEMESRYEVEMEHYAKIINIEALTMLEMARKQLLPAINRYMSELANTAATKLAVSESLSVRSETKTLAQLSKDADEMSDAIDALAAAQQEAQKLGDMTAKANTFHDKVLPCMETLRAVADDAETVCGEEYWPLPSYSKMLHYVEN
ncbi:glutamine synthetase III family protein [Faecalibacterium gallinarum]|uniref:Glutamine synthetase n=1 Tax=Faecalibacterium gallinarum TaxID=2903556 RepID=A0AA37IWH0_9FIRM|nr:glutamine synthetase III [Faecalibacterium gallinarum]GJN63710.1 glutamine synthetase [Faecalibacterium gallinarum]